MTVKREWKRLIHYTSNQGLVSRLCIYFRLCMCSACVCAWTVRANIRLQEPQGIGCLHLIRFHLFLESGSLTDLVGGIEWGMGMTFPWQLWGFLCGEIKPKNSPKHGEWKVFNGWTVCRGNCVSIKVLTMKSLLSSH